VSPSRRPVCWPPKKEKFRDKERRPFAASRLSSHCRCLHPNVRICLPRCTLEPASMAVGRAGERDRGIARGPGGLATQRFISSQCRRGTPTGLGEPQATGSTSLGRTSAKGPRRGSTRPSRVTRRHPIKRVSSAQFGHWGWKLSRSFNWRTVTALRPTRGRPRTHSVLAPHEVDSIMTSSPGSAGSLTRGRHDRLWILGASLGLDAMSSAVYAGPPGAYPSTRPSGFLYPPPQNRGHVLVDRCIL
jgi:hypothetical protein